MGVRRGCLGRGDSGAEAAYQWLSQKQLVSLVQNLTKSADLRAAGMEPASRQRAIMLLGGLYELVAVTLEEGGDVRDITETAVDCTLAILSTRH